MRTKIATALLAVSLSAVAVVPAAEAGTPSRETRVSINYSMSGSFQGRVQTARKCRARRNILIYADRGPGPDGTFGKVKTDAEGRYRFAPTMVESGVEYYTVARVDRRRGVICERGRSRRVAFDQ